jgi:hypothetical protein
MQARTALAIDQIQGRRFGPLLDETDRAELFSNKVEISNGKQYSVAVPCTSHPSFGQDYQAELLSQQFIARK